MEAVAKPEEYQAFLTMAASPGTGYGSLKKEFARTFLERFAPIQEKYRRLMENQVHLEQLLADGAARARTLAQPILQKAREATGLKNAL
jgi:tryptophanyl-tRNA synthetase